jgi:hypothetical protein
VDSVNANSSFSTAAEGSAILRLAVVIDFTVELQPRSLFLRRKIFHYFHQVAHHFLTNSADQGRALRRYANHDLAPVVSGNRTDHHSQIFQPRHQSARRRCSVSHSLRDRRHRKHFFLVEISEKEKLRKGNVARRELFAQMQNEATLHFHHDVRKLFSVGANLMRRILCERCFRVQSHLS